jgi:hypothetical protein
VPDCVAMLADAAARAAAEGFSSLKSIKRSLNVDAHAPPCDQHTKLNSANYHTFSLKVNTPKRTLK